MPQDALPGDGAGSDTTGVTGPALRSAADIAALPGDNTDTVLAGQSPSGDEAGTGLTAKGEALLPDGWDGFVRD
jgi:hypothetical protein